MPTERTRLVSLPSSTFNAQVAVEPRRISELLQADGWQTVPETDWRWIIQALNPEPDQASLPLLGRAFQGHSEILLLRKNLPPDGRLLTLRLWDSGVRLMPGRQILYLGQLSEERLVQRFGLFSYWRSTAVAPQHFRPIRERLSGLEQKIVAEHLLLLRDPRDAESAAAIRRSGSGAGPLAGFAVAPTGR
jgi:hypothetical protein